MKQFMKRLLGMMLVIAMVIGMIPISGMTVQAASISQGTRIYFDTNGVDNFTTAGAVPSVLFKTSTNDTNSTWVLMQLVEGSSTVYYADADRNNVTHVQFRRSSGSNENWHSGTSILELQEGKNCYTITSWNKDDVWTNSGSWSTYDSSSDDSSTTTVDNVIYLHATVGTAPFKARFSGNGSITEVNMVKVADGYYRATIPAGKTTVMFVDTNGNWLAYGENWPTIPTDGNNCFEPGGYGSNNWTWTTYSEAGTSTVETFMVSTELWDYFNNTRVGSDGSKYSANNEGNGTDWKDVPYSAWNYVIAGSTTGSTSQRPTVPLYFGGLGHRANQLMEEINGDTWTKHELPNFSITANVALSDYGNAAAQGIVGTQLLNGNLTDVTNTSVELPYFKDENLYNGGKQVTAYYSDLQFPFKKTTLAGGQTIYSYDSAKDYPVYYSYENDYLYKGTAYSLNNTNSEKGYYPFDENNAYAGATDERNMGFGTKFTIPFTLSMDENNQINGQDVIFNFTGDDDVWVFIDDVLVLDMGGAHYKASGEINFTNQTVTVDEAYDVIQEVGTWSQGKTTGSSSAESWMQPSSTSAGVTVGEDIKTFASITGKFTGETKTKSLADIMADDSKVHTLTFFYMERGMYDSNMSISFTFNPVPSGLILSKEVNTTNVNDGLKSVVKTKDYFDFEVKQNGNLATDVNYQKEYDGAGSKSASTEEDAVVKNLADNIYAYNFTDANGNAAFKRGDSMVITEKNVDSEKYSTTWYVWDQKANKAVTRDSSDTVEDDTIASFTLGTATTNIYAPGVDYVVNFVNTPKVGSVAFTKQWGTGTAPTGTEFDFLVEVDLDGDGTEYTYETYNLKYSIENSEYVARNGVFTAAVGEKVVFPGIPVGAKVRVTETVTSGDSWEIADASKATVETDAIGDAKCYEISITNKSKTIEIDKVIYVEAGKENGTDYKVKDGEDTIIVDTATLVDETQEGEITVTVDSETGEVNVDPTEPNQTYEITYTGDKNGVDVTGTITVHTYAMSDDLYVFDYGLKSDLADITDGNGMFQNDSLYINGVETTAKFTALDASELTQSTITADNLPYALEQVSDGSAGAALSGDNQVIFEPSDFMDKQETATYGVTVYAKDKEKIESAEDGVVLENAKVKVMPADVVYYEDNFSAITVTDNTENTEDESNEAGTHQNDTQSNANNTLHGNDDAYVDDAEDSDGGSIILRTSGSYDENGKYVSGNTDTVNFTFKGTGFDIVGRSSSDSAVLTVVYSYTDTDKEKVTKVLVVDTYFANGDLYQIPVVSVRDLPYGECTVTIGVSASTRGTTFYLDGIRIYNPAQEDTEVTNNYQSSEQGVSFLNVHDMLVGTGDVTESIVRVYDEEDPDAYDDYVVDIQAEGRSAVMVRVPAYMDDDTEDVNCISTPELFGYSYTEDVLADNDPTNTGLYTSKLTEYLAKGPNNEVYLGTENAIAFYAEAGTTVQVEAKKVNIGGTDYAPEGEESYSDFAVPVLRTVKKTEDGFKPEIISEIETSTAMYYDIPVDEEHCIKVGEKYLVIILGSTTPDESISISNIKTNGKITLPEVDNENIILNVNTGVEEPECAIQIEKITVSNAKARKKATVNITISGYDSDRIGEIGFDIYLDSVSNGTDELTLAKASYSSKKDNGKGTYTFTYQVTMPTKAQNMKLTVIPKYITESGDVQSIYRAEKTIKVTKN